MVRFFLLFLLLGVAVPSAGIEIKTSTEKGYRLVDATVAVVNGEPILASDVKLYMLLFGEGDYKKALQKLIDIYLVARYAEARGLEIPPQKLQEMVENFARGQGITVEKLYTELQKLGLGGRVFQNLLKKYNLYTAAIQLFVLKPLLENKGELELLIAAKTPESVPYYTVEILPVPKEEALKNEDLLVGMNLKEVSEKLGIEPIKLTVSPDNLKPQIAQVVKRLKPGQTDFAEDDKNIYLVKLVKVEYKTPENARERALEEIKKEKIERFIKKLKEEAVIKILVPDLSNG